MSALFTGFRAVHSKPEVEEVVLTNPELELSRIVGGVSNSNTSHKNAIAKSAETLEYKKKGQAIRLSRKRFCKLQFLLFEAFLHHRKLQLRLCQRLQNHRLGRFCRSAPRGRHLTH